MPEAKSTRGKKATTKKVEASDPLSFFRVNGRESLRNPTRRVLRLCFSVRLVADGVTEGGFLYGGKRGGGKGGMSAAKCCLPALSERNTEHDT